MFGLGGGIKQKAHHKGVHRVLEEFQLQKRSQVASHGSIKDTNQFLSSSYNPISNISSITCEGNIPIESCLFVSVEIVDHLRHLTVEFGIDLLQFGFIRCNEL